MTHRKEKGWQNSNGEHRETHPEAAVTTRLQPEISAGNLVLLHEAAGLGDLELVKVLLERDPESILTQDDAGLTPLHMAAGWGRREVAELLLANHADVQATDNDGLTPLHWAAFWDQTDLADLLLAHHADINAIDNAGHTPLHYAILKSYTSAAELLLTHGAKVSAEETSRLTPMREKTNLRRKGFDSAAPTPEASFFMRTKH